MRTVLLLAAVFLCGGFAMTWAGRATARAGEKPGQVLRHIVLYKFKDDATPAEVQDVVDTFAALPKKIDGIVAFEHGTNVSPEGKSDGLTHVFVVSFANEQARDAYLTHPAHQAYVNVVKDRREKVVVFDYWADRWASAHD